MSFFKSVIKFSPCVLAAAALVTVLVAGPTHAVDGPGSGACTATEFNQCVAIEVDGYYCDIVPGETDRHDNCTDCNGDGCATWQYVRVESYRCSNGTTNKDCKKKFISWGGKCSGYCPTVGDM